MLLVEGFLEGIECELQEGTMDWSTGWRLEIKTLAR
jgi:hypothetical protein